MIVAVFLMAGCSSKTVDVPSVPQSSGQKTIFEELNVSTIYVSFHQNEDEVVYDVVKVTRFSEDEVKAFYSQNKAVLSGKENESNETQLFDCLQINADGTQSQCYKELSYSVFSGRSALIAKKPLEGSVMMLLAPVGMVIDTLNFSSLRLFRGGVHT